MTKRKKINAGKLIYIAVFFCLLSCLFLTGCKKQVKLEAGQPLPSAAELVNDPTAVFQNDTDTEVLTKPGKYDIPILVGNKKKIVSVRVVDTTPPSFTVWRGRVAVGTPLPDASCFIENMVEYSNYTVTYDKKYTTDTLGSIDKIEFTVRDAYGNKRKGISALDIVEDTQAPTLKVNDITIFVGEGISYLSGVQTYDDCDGKVTVSVDHAAVRSDRVGDYPVYYTAQDAAGNTSKQESATVHVLSVEYSEEKLWQKIDEILAEIVTDDMSKEEKCRAVYNYVFDAMAYASSSDKSDWKRAAYFGLIQEEGDCFSYFALSKAFFERLGIQNLDVQRDGLDQDGSTHYWNMVNIGSYENPRWYHFDATHIRTDYPHHGDLLTDKQIDAFNRAREGFYKYKKENYPKSATEIITPTPTLEGFYR